MTVFVKQDEQNRLARVLSWREKVPRKGVIFVSTDVHASPQRYLLTSVEPLSCFSQLFICMA